MKVDGGGTNTLANAARSARNAEQAGYDGLWVGETNRDPFLPLTLVAAATSDMSLGTAIAVAFARSPMTTAQIAEDLQEFSGGRFILGLGTQTEAHIRERFSMPWSSPLARLREYVAVLRAIWECWRGGEPLDFRGDFYQHTLMTPFFMPDLPDHDPPPVFLGAVGPRMSELTGEVADGLHVHTFTTARYMREVTLPHLTMGLDRAGRKRQDVEVALPTFVVTGRTEETMAEMDRFARQQIAFYASTPAYRPVLDLHGWGELQGELHRLSVRGRWSEMGGLIDDTILDAFAVVGEPDVLGTRIRTRFEGLLDRVSCYGSSRFDAPWPQIIEDIKG